MPYGRFDYIMTHITLDDVLELALEFELFRISDQ